MNKVERLIKSERACCVGHSESFRSADFHGSTARFVCGTLEFRNKGEEVVLFAYDQACVLSRWLEEMLREERP